MLNRITLPSFVNIETDGNVYPALVTLEMVEKAKEIAKGNIILPKKKYSTLYFGKNILRCPECGKVMMAVKARNFYHCTKCGCKTTININMVDSALWALAAPLYAKEMENKAEGKKESYEAQIAITQKKVAVAKADIEAMKERAEKVEYRAYVEGTMDTNKADKFVADLQKKITEKEKEIVALNPRYKATRIFY